MNDKYLSIAKHYEKCLEQHGDTHLGVDWPDLNDAQKRYQVMLEVINYSKRKPEVATMLDFGCGAAHLLDYIKTNYKNHNIIYAGLDISPKFVEVSKKKFPNTEIFCLDILKHKLEKNFDFIVLNGVFTEKRELSFDEMLEYFKNVLTSIFPNCNYGLAFNVMSKNVDWEREDLFHLSLDLLTSFLCKQLSRNFVIRNDYGLYEYTVYLYK